MKKIFFILCFIWLSITGSAQNDSVIKFQNIIQSFENKEGATTITIAKPMFGLIGKMIKSDELQNIQPLLSQVNSVKMLIIDKAEAPILETQLNSALKKMKIEELMTINSGTNKIKYLSSGTENDFVKDLMFSINSDEDNILILLDGKIKTEEVQKLINTNRPNPLDKTASQTNENEDCNCTDDVENFDTSQKIDNKKFTTISAKFSGKLYITKGNDYSIEMQDAKNSSGRKSARVEDGTLIIEGDDNMIVRITAPNIDKINVKYSNTITIEKFETAQDLEINLNYASILNGKISTEKQVRINASQGSQATLSIDANSVVTDLKQGSILNLKGAIANFKANVSMSSILNAEQAALENVEIKANHASVVNVNAIKSINITAANASIVNYKGGAKPTTSNASGNSIINNKIN